MTAELDANVGGEVSSPKDLSNGHANADANADSSYVFVNGNDVYDSLHSDLNSNSNSTVDHITKQSNTNDTNNDEDTIEASELKHSLIIVNECDVDQENKPSYDQGVNVYCNLEADAELGMRSVNGQPQGSVVINGSVESDDGAPQLIESSEILPSPVHNAADLPVETPVADSPGEHGDDFKQNREAADVHLETLIFSGPATDETEQGTFHTPEVVVVNDQETLQLNNTSETALPSSVDSKDVHVESCRCLPHDPVSASKATTEPDVRLDSTVADNLPSAETETGKLDMRNGVSSDSCSVDNTIVVNEVENCSVGTDIVSSCQSNDARPETETMESEVKVSTWTSGDSNLKSKAFSGVTEYVDSQPMIVHDAAAESSINDSVENGSSSLHTFPDPNVKAGTEIENRSVVSCADMPVADVSEPEVLNESVINSQSALSCIPDVLHAESSISCSLENESSLPTCPGDNVEAGPEIENRSVVGCTEIHVGSSVDSGSEVLNGSAISSQSALNCIPDVVKVESGGIQFTNEKTDDKTCQEVEENRGIQFTGGESDDKTCQEAEDKGEIQFTGREHDDKTCQEENKEIQLIAGEIDGKTCDVEENREIQFSGRGDYKTCQDVVENQEIQFTGGESDDKICQEGDENREIQFTDGELDDKTCQEVEENGGIQFTGGESDDKTWQEVEENRGIHSTGGKNDDETCQEVWENGEVQFTAEESADKECQEVEENGEIQFTSGESADKKCQEVEKNGEAQFIGGGTADKECQEVEEDREVQFTGEESDDKSCQEFGGNDGNLRDQTMSTPEGSTVDASEMQNVGVEVVKRPFYFLVKVPRYDDENLREQIKSAQSEVDEKTQSRDVIRAEIQMIRDTYKKYGDNIEAIMAEEKVARELLKSKRQEIDSLQSMVNKMKNAISVEDIDGRIRNMEHMIAHETLPLKEEKQFIRDIKQLKQLREQFSSSMGKQDEVQQAFDQKDQIEERLKLLRKEAESLREDVVKAEAATQAAKKKQKDQSEKLKKLYAEFKVADDIRQEAYKHLQSLRKQAYDKNKHFWKYKDDAKQANDLLSKGDKEALQYLCVNQVERVLELWNNNNDFRKEYVNSNIRSTLRRLKTLDGRALGPDEEPPVIRSFVNSRLTKDSSASQISTIKEEKSEQVVQVKSEKVDEKPIAVVGEQKNETANFKRPAKPAVSANGLATVSGRDEIKDTRDEEPKRTKKEEELARKAEELRKEEEAARLKEQRRLEEKIKAKEALERKKRIAEKAQARAILRAQKEAEQKEKEREKRARKKEKRKVVATEDSDLMPGGESTPITETIVETRESSEIREKSVTVSKRPKKSSQFTKQTKAKSTPPLPLRNRSKRRIQTWTWVLITALVIIALFWLGNSSFPSKFGLQRFGF